VSEQSAVTVFWIVGRLQANLSLGYFEYRVELGEGGLGVGFGGKSVAGQLRGVDAGEADSLAATQQQGVAVENLRDLVKFGIIRGLAVFG